MMIRSICLAGFVMVSAASLQAQDHDKGWFKYFSGDWTRESTISTQAGDKTTVMKENIEWTAKVLAGGTASWTQGKNAEGVESANFMRWDGFLGKVCEYGNDSQGISWTIVFDKVDDSIMEGKLTAFGPDGKGEGTAVIKRSGKDSYRTDWSLKMSTGSTMTGIEINKRK
jgi:hypothetical protein